MRCEHLVVRTAFGCEQLVDHLPGIGFGDLGQVQVDHGGLEATVAQVFLDRLEADTRFEQMGGVGMAQSVARNLLAKVQLPRDFLEGRLDRADAHRCG